YLKMDGGGSRLPATPASVATKAHFIYQEGREVYKFAVKGMANVTAEIVQKNGFTGQDVDLFVPHQANLRIIEAAQRRVGLQDSQVGITIDRYGNTTSASIPSCLRVALEEGRLKEGSLVVATSFGAGFTWGSVLLRWNAPL
ncbi:MAG: 3-oxoacyl-[acyl-carrier-protein] synthase III C-terminal domain-containing protein, partial [Candidatus Krumholzibacteriia bacterium]